MLEQRPLDFKLLLEGIVVPFSDITVTDTINATSSAVLTLPFTIQGRFIRPRTTVMVFFRYKDVKDMPYNLFFFGEVAQLTTIKRGAGRAIQLGCVSLSNYLDSSYLSFVVGSVTKQEFPVAETGGAVVQVLESSEMSNILQQILAASHEEPETYTVRLLEKLWGSPYVPDMFLGKYYAYGMREKFQCLPADMIADFLKGILRLGMEGLSQQLTARMSQFERVSEHLATVKSFFMLDYVENRSLARQSFMFKPILTYGVPPRCNVIFPSQYDHLIHTDNFLQTPTRSIYNLASYVGLDGETDKSVLAAPYGVSPYELYKSYTNALGKNKAALPNLFFTAEEVEKGVLPYMGAEQFLDQVWFKSLQGSTKDFYEKLHQWQDFKFFYLRARGRRIDMADCAFMPYLLCGFPSAVLDNQGFYLGYLESVVHVISSSGRANTRVNITGVRDATDPVPGRPWWLESLSGDASSYSTGRISEEIYKKYIGCEAALETDEFIKQRQDAASVDEQILFSKEMIGSLVPADIMQNSRDLQTIVPGTVLDDSVEMQHKLFKSLMARFLDYGNEARKHEYAEGYGFRPASSLQDFVRLHEEFLKPAPGQEELFEAGEIVDLISESKTVQIDSTSLTAAPARTVTASFFRTINQRVVLAYRDSIGKINVDATIYGGKTRSLPSYFPPGDLISVATAPYRSDITPQSVGLGFRSVKSGGADLLGAATGGRYAGIQESGATKDWITNTGGGILPPNGGQAHPMKPGTYRVSSEFLKQRAGYKHHGVDMAGKVGTPIYAVRDGKAYKRTEGRGVNHGYGHYVEVIHGDGTSTIYAHLSQHGDFKDGQMVGAGSVIGALGNTGRSTGPHLHFEHKKQGAYGKNRQVYDPMKFLQ